MNLPAQRDPSPDVFDRLQGEWSFVREVPGKAKMTGRARILPTGEGRARYDETARVLLADGKTLTGSQSYLYRRLPAPANGFDVLFSENEELFERLDFHLSSDRSLRADAEHHCPPDHYVSHFALDREDHLFVEHAVRGPRKDYVVRTTYRRVGPARDRSESRR
ncbi:MAG TPA: DUF6314 family protein [Acidobacteriaceae bacterium]|jgi:hypothetical protein|nr:DUF6314 family protein [Acidobacteriaceae bacterium]